MLVKYIAVKYVGGFQTQVKTFFFEVAIKKSVGSYACILLLIMETLYGETKAMKT